MVLIISASNSRISEEHSVSSKVSKLLKSKLAGNVVEEVRLKDYNIQSCRLCGDCSKNSKCPYDESFNTIHKKINQADKIIWIVPHYSPLPSKLMSVFEKINEIIYLKWLNNPDFKSPYQEKKTTVIAHGAMTETEKTIDYYYSTLVMPVAKTLSGLGFGLMKLDQSHEFGVVFGLEKDSDLVTKTNGLFPEIEFNIKRLDSRFDAIIEKFR